MKKQGRKARNSHSFSGSNRWKWMAGATAATAAGVSASQAGLITINLTNNYISARGGNHLNADLTGDGKLDTTLTGATFFYSYRGSTKYGFHFPRFSAAVDINGVVARGYDNGDYPFRSVTLGLLHRFATGGSSVYLTGSIPVSFKDLHINNGKLTSGWLDVTVTPDKVQFDDYAYYTPDQGSSLALLAMGAGGILALRRSRTVRERA